MYADWSAALLPRDGAAYLECQSERASDYYGLGVRLGVYFAWLGSYVANTILPSEFGPASDTSTIFLLTLLIAMTNDARTKDLNQVDGLVLMHLCGGTVFGILSIWGYRTRLYHNHGARAVRHFGGFGTHLRLAVSLAVSAFGFWFWLYGINSFLRPIGPDDGSTPPNPIECSTTYTFFFAKMRADGGIRYYYMVVSMLCIAYFGGMLIVSSLAGIAAFNNVRGLLSFRQWSNANRSKYATGFTHKELKYMYYFLRVANLFWLIFSAVTVEMTLNYNHIAGVLGGRHDGQLQLPSQLLPFLLGMFSFIRILYQIFKVKFGEAPEKAADHAEPGDLTLPPGAEIINHMVVLSADGAPLPPARADSYQLVVRTLPVRLLVGWLPWLGLVAHPSNRHSRLSTIVSRGTGLSSIHHAPAKHEESTYAGQTTEPKRDVEVGENAA
ncbi:hypothetical protein B0T19DRAFT_115426 [Cercophora scortea]|uniref:Uncharacterized protein n=1 Tax=Cercophora scortea TaxID=314031 RepID=A0AAE0MHU2_9PEZI|nr:hypothetical protein B0T19DRAFT_115426 [Cercophora scortea]